MLLIYDDEQDICEILKDMLSAAGCKSICTSNKEKFMRVIQNPNLIFTGIFFDLTGLTQDDLEIIKNTEYPAICITGGFPPDGFQAVTKPFKEQELIDQLEFTSKTN